MDTQPKKSMVLPIAITVLISALIFGIGGYYLASNQSEPLVDNSDALTTPKATVSPTATATAATAACEATGSYKVYSTTNYGFCFTYLNSWIVTDGAAEGGATWRVSVTDKVVPDSDYPGKLSIHSYKNLKSLDTKNTGAVTLKEYLDKSAAGDDPVYQNVKAAKVGDKDGYTAEAGPNQFGGGKHYFVNLADGSIVTIWTPDTGTDAATTAVITSLKFSK